MRWIPRKRFREASERVTLHLVKDEVDVSKGVSAPQGRGKRE